MIKKNKTGYAESDAENVMVIVTRSLFLLLLLLLLLIVFVIFAIIT